MGEVNHRLLVGNPRLIEKPFAWTDVPDPVAAVGRLRGGQGVLVNLAPGAPGEFSLILAPGEMKDIDTEDKMADTVHGWFAPGPDLPDFLKRYSMAGGTHHSAFVYGASTAVLTAFARLMGWETVVLTVLTWSRRSAIRGSPLAAAWGGRDY